MSALGFMAPGLVRGIDDLQDRQRQNRIDTLLETEESRRQSAQEQDLAMRREDMALRRDDVMYNRGIQTKERERSWKVQDEQHAQQQKEWKYDDTTRSLFPGMIAADQELRATKDPVQHRAKLAAFQASPEWKQFATANPQGAETIWKGQTEYGTGLQKKSAAMAAAEAFGQNDVQGGVKTLLDAGFSQEEAHAARKSSETIKNEGIGQAMLLAIQGDYEGASKVYSSTGKDRTNVKISGDAKTGDIISQTPDGKVNKWTPAQQRYILAAAGIKMEKPEHDPLAVPRYKAVSDRANNLDKSIFDLQQGLQASIDQLTTIKADDPRYQAGKNSILSQQTRLAEARRQRAALDAVLNGSGQGIPDTGTAPATGGTSSPAGGVGIPAPGPRVSASPSPLSNDAISIISKTKAFNAMPPAARRQMLATGTVPPAILAEIKSAQASASPAAPPEFAAIQQQRAADAAPENQVDPQLKPFTNGIPMDVGTWKGETIGSSNVPADILDPLTRTVQRTTAYGDPKNPGAGIEHRTSSEAENKAAAILARVNDKTDPEFMSWYRQQEKRTLPKTAVGLLQVYADYRNAGSNN
jgi:hypothetical protein